MKKTTIIETIVVLYTILFLYTGISKLMDYTIFKEQIATSPILAPIAKPVALLLPWTEFIVTLLLIIPRWRMKGFYASAFLMSIFTIYIIAILSFSKHLPCSCGGILAEMTWSQHLIFNIVFIALGITGIIAGKQLRKNNKEVWASIKTHHWGINTGGAKSI